MSKLNQFQVVYAKLINLQWLGWSKSDYAII